MAEKPRLLIHSNAPWTGTGYGQQTALIAPTLAEHYQLALSSFYGLEGNIIPWNGVPVLPGFGGHYGNEHILEHANMFFDGDLRGGLVLTLMDVWVLDPSVWARMNVASWVPVDHEPVPTPVLAFFQNTAAVPIAMSRFGQEQLEAAGLDPLYCPHVVDSEVYAPVNQKKARAAIGVPKDGFVVGMVAANKGNPSRKCFAEAFQAFKRFSDKHPDALLYLHVEVTGRFDGVNLQPLMDDIGIDKTRVLISDQYRVVHRPYPPETMAKVYSSMDVLLAPSAGEGFGIPVLEAAACGVPSIVSDFSAQPEVPGAAWTVEGQRTYSPIGSWQFLPDPDDILSALNDSYGMPEAQRKSVAKKIRSDAEGYDVKTVLTDHMLPALEKVSEGDTVKVVAA